MRRVALALLFVVGECSVCNADLAMITECSHPLGMALDLKPTFQAWHSSNMHETKLTFIRMSLREYDVIIKDTHGDIHLRSHDPNVIKVFEDEDNLTIVSAPPIGLVETFQLSTLADGQRIALWNILRNNSRPMKITNVANYLFKCEDR